MTKEARLFKTAALAMIIQTSLDLRNRQSLLEHWVTVEREFVPDHSVGNVFGHLFVRDLVAGQVLDGELGAIDRGRKVVIVLGEVEVDLLDLIHEVLLDLLGVGDVTEVNHLECLAGGSTASRAWKVWDWSVVVSGLYLEGDCKSALLIPN